MSLARDPIAAERAMEQRRPASPDTVLDSLTGVRDRLTRMVDELEETLSPYSIPYPESQPEPCPEDPHRGEYWRDIMARIVTIDAILSRLRKITTSLDL